MASASIALRGEERGGRRGARAERGTSERARGVHEKFETSGVEMLSGMQERTILIKESARGLAARSGVAASTRERFPREFQRAARCAECRRQAGNTDKEAIAARSTLLPSRASPSFRSPRPVNSPARSTLAN